MQLRTLISYQAWIGIIVALSIGAVFVWSSSSTEAKEQPSERFEISFSKPQSLGDVVSTARTNGVEIVSLQDTFLVGGVPTTDFYFVQPDKQSSNDILSDYRAARQGMLADMKNDLKKMGPPPGARARSIAEMVASPNANQIDIESVGVTGSELKVNALANTLKGTAKSGAKDQGEAGALITATAPAVSTWAPKQGWLYTGVSATAGNRYATNYIWWNDVSGLRVNSLTTYEHELLLDNSDGKTYFDASENFYKQPKMTYASSNLPSPYLDSRAFDARRELAYTIGSAAGSNIQANTSYWYNTYFRILPGNTNTDFAKVSGQLGRKNTSCIIIPFALCVFGEATYILAPWNITVPGTKNWIRS